MVLTQQTQNCGMQIVDLANAKESQRTGKLTHAARRGFETTASYNRTGTPRSAM